MTGGSYQGPNRGLQGCGTDLAWFLGVVTVLAVLIAFLGDVLGWWT